MTLFGKLIDERFLTHRLRSTSIAGMIGAVVAGGLFLYHYYADHTAVWDLFAVIAVMAVAKLALMTWYHLTD